MRKNFTQKFLTIFVFLTVYAFGFKAYAQPAPADCTTGDGGNINVGIDGKDTVCRGGNAPLIRGNQQNALSDSGTGASGGPIITFQWQYRNASTGFNFVDVDASVMESDLSNCNNPRNCDGKGPNFNPGHLLLTTDFVRIRYSGSSGVPQNCFKVSDIVTIYAQDFEKPFITNGQNSMILSQNPGVCGATVNYEPNTIAGTDNCTGNSGRTGDTLRRAYSIPSGSFFPIGTTRVVVTVSDSSSNFDTTGFNVTVVDTSKPVFTGPGNLFRFTEPGFCSANITATEFRPTFDNCTSTNNDGLRTLTYTIRDSASGAVVSSPLTGVNFIRDTTLRRGAHIITYFAEDSAGNSQTEIDTVFVRDNIRPIVVAPASRRYTTDACFRTVASLASETGTAGRGPRATGGAFSIVPTITENCSPLRTLLIYGPNDSTQLFNTLNTNPLNGPIYNNTLFTIGTSTLIYVGVDSSGNRSDSTLASSKQTILIIDTLAPKVFCQANNPSFGTSDANVTRVGTSFTPCSYTLPPMPVTYNDGATCDDLNNRVYGPQAPRTKKGVKFVRYSYHLNGATASYFDTTVLDANGTGGGTINVTAPFRIGVTTVKTVSFDTTGAQSLPVTYGSTNPAAPTNANGAAGTANVSDTCSFQVTLLDNSRPTVSCNSTPYVAQLVYNASTGLTTATVTGANVGSATDCSTTTLTIRKQQRDSTAASSITFDCDEVGMQAVTLIVTDAAGNVDSCTTAMVRVVSSVVATASSTGGATFCTASGQITTSVSGGSGSYTYDIVSATNGGTGNNTGASNGVFTDLTAGNYVILVTDGNNCSDTAMVTIANSQKATTDVSVVTNTPSGQGTTLSPTNTSTRVDVRVTELGGFNAPNVTVRVAKSELPLGVTLSLVGSFVNNNDWQMTEDGVRYTFSKRAGSQDGGTGLNCGRSSTFSVTVTRSGTPTAGPFGFTVSLGAIVGESNQFNYNNSFSPAFTIIN